jgi:protein gp37
MAENSKIEWCDHTFNPWIGCQKVSPGCDHCYAEAMMDKRYGRVQWGPHGERKRTSEDNWKKPLVWQRERTAIGHGCSAPPSLIGSIIECRANGGPI